MFSWNGDYRMHLKESLVLFRPVIFFSLVFLNLVNIFTQPVLNYLCHLQLKIWRVKVNVFEHLLIVKS